MLVKTPRDAEERDLSWFDYPILRDIARDGSVVLFDEEGEGGGPNYSAFVRRTDGAPAVRISDGYALRLSPDGQSATTNLPSNSGNVLIITPIGPGDPRTVKLPLPTVLGSRWLPDRKRLVVVGAEAGRPIRTFEFTLQSGAVRPLTPEGITGTLVSPDGRLLVAAAADGTRQLWPIGGGEPTPIRGLAAQDAVAAWSADGTALFVSAPTTGRARDIARLEIATGRRQVIATVGPTDPAGVRTIGVPLVSADGRTYAYRYSQELSDLFVGSGLR